MIAACGDLEGLGNGLADRPSAPMTAREPLTPGAAGLAWTRPASSDDWSIGPSGVGRLVVGGASATVGAHGAAGTGQATGSSCTPVQPPGAPAGVRAWITGERVVAVTVEAPGPRTLHGAQVGTPLEELRRLYAGRLELGNGGEGEWLVARPAATLAGHPVAFRIVDGVVERIRVSSPDGDACH